MSFLSKIFGDANERYINTLRPIVEQIGGFEAEFNKLSDEALKGKTAEFRERLDKDETLDDLLPEAFAAVREASRRNLKMRHFDVQLIGGMVLHQGKIGQMRTGEGKTLMATLPAYLNALEGKGVHVVTVNDYLSRRDAVWMGQIYHALGMTVGVINHETAFLYDATHQQPADPLDAERDQLGAFHIVHEFLRPVTRKDAYKADITYGTNNEYGFDYLRDNMAYSEEAMVQRPHNFAVVDEVDSILIDESRTPLIISAPDSDSTKLYETFSRIVPKLVENSDYNVDEKLHAVSITESGIEKVEKQLGLANIYQEGGIRYVHHLEQALKAHVLYKRDRHYVVQPGPTGASGEGKVIIVDEFTGRLMPGRRWSEGLHQAVEAKEGVKVEKETRTMATVTFQNYFRLYKKLSGMTGTAKTSAEEFHKVYKLDVAIVPTNRPMIRKDLPDRIYKNELGKFQALVKEVRERNAKGQPVLIGTVSIEKNELLSTLLERDGVSHQVLNAKNHEREAEILAQAGRSSGVTVATNMAGRGVDIILGGFPSDDEDAQVVRQAGGLHVIGTERHEARRIDDQLRGRAGRQGDPGSSQFFVSVQDDLMRVFGGDRLHSLMNTLGVGDEDAIENGFVSRAIEQAQSRIEGHHFDSRKYVLEYDDVMNKHRESMYALRRKVLSTKDNTETILDYLTEQVQEVVTGHVNVDGGFDTEEIYESLKAIAPFSNDLHAKLQELANQDETGEELREYLRAETVRLYEQKEKEVGAEAMRRLETIVLLRTIDELWVDHIEAMEYLQHSVRLRAYGQRDPLVEYKMEGQKMFETLHTTVRGQVANVIFKVGMMQAPTQTHTMELRPQVDDAPSLMQKDSQSAGAEQHISKEHPEIGRNDPCHCGSGKKFKKCHGA